MKKLLVLIGLGVAIKYFLDSDSGRDVKNQVKDWLKEAQDGFSDKLEMAKEKVHDVKQRMN